MHNMQNQKSGYFPEINYLRGFAILAVISIHVSTYNNKMTCINSLTFFYIIVDVFSHFAVPAFIFISGFVLYNKYYTNIEIKKFYINRLNSIIPQYLTISTFYMIALFYGAKIIGRSIDWSFSSILYRYVTGGAFYHLWFFVLLIQIYILYPYILKIYDYFQSKHEIQLLLTITFILGIVYNSFIDMTLPIGKITLFSGYIFYFVFGMFTRNNYDMIKSIPFRRGFAFFSSIILFLGTFLLTINYFNTHFSDGSFSSSSIVKLSLNSISILYYTVIIIIGLYLSTSLSNLSQFKIIDKIGSYSFSIYLVHAIILYTLVLLLTKVSIDWNDLLFYPLTFFLTLILSILVVKIIRLFPNSEYLIGKKK